MKGILLLTFFWYSIALLGSSTTTVQTNNNNHHVRCLQSDRAALLDFKDGLIDPGTMLSSWRGLDCCQWIGIACNNITGAVTEIDLHSRRYVSLSGDIRHSLINLESLVHLDLSFNAFTDTPIPEFFGSFKSLQYLNLSNSGFTGNVPPHLGNLSLLQYLDVSNKALAVSDFQWITGLVSLKVLNMESVDLSLIDPNSLLEALNTFPSLEELDLSDCQLSGSISSLSFTNFSSLALIDLNHNNFESTFPNWLVNVSSLVHINLGFCSLEGTIPVGLGELSRLRFLDLGSNVLSASFPSLFNAPWKSIEFLDFHSNMINSTIPETIGNMSSLTGLGLSNNNIEGGIPSTVGSLCKLVNIDISENKLNGILSDLLEGTEKCSVDAPFPSLETLTLRANQLHGSLPEWLGRLQNLQELTLSENLFEGSIPDSLGSLTKLNILILSGNKLNGTLPESIGQLSELTKFDVSLNALSGILSEVHFSRLSKVQYLLLSSNSFVLNVSSNWLPPFQPSQLEMASCHLGPSFPAWIKSLNKTAYLDISNASISDSIPSWFWDINNLLSINASSNQIYGELPKPFKGHRLVSIDFSFNLLEGLISLPDNNIQLLDLSKNRFHGPIPQIKNRGFPPFYYINLSGNQLTGQIPADIGDLNFLNFADFSRNKLSGSIPNSIGNCSYLTVLHLGQNRLSSSIPESLGQLINLQSLHLNDNLISGKLPSSMINLSSLEILDLSNNKIEDRLPQWLGESFQDLRILKLRSNAFSGSIMFDFSTMTSLQILDLAENNLTGTIPKSIGDLKVMAQERGINSRLLDSVLGVYLEQNLVLYLKNQQQTFVTRILSLLTLIDLSGNNFSGEIPQEITKLQGLMVLNLSRNHLSRQIPGSIAGLQRLFSFDLSNNQLTGTIPPGIASLTSLSHLNLSRNMLSGTIPYSTQMSTFQADSFEGNLRLCGAPLGRCNSDDSGKRNNTEHGTHNTNNDEFIIDTWFYLSIGMGFAAGIIVPCLVLMINKPWIYRYSEFVDKIVYKMLGRLENIYVW